MSKPKISVIIALYNAETTLRRCLDSLLAQTFQDFNVIIVDDGSTDSSLEICREYAKKDSRFRVYHKENGGVGSARQYADDQLKDESVFCIHVDPDDWIDKEMLETMYNKAIQESADMVFCDIVVEDAKGTIYSKQEPKSKDSKEVLEQMLSELYGSLCNKLIARGLYVNSNTRFVEGLNYCEDVYIVIRLLSFGCKVAYVNQGFYHYDRAANPGSYTHIWHNRPVEEYELFIQNCAPYLDTPRLKQNLEERIASIIKMLIYAPRNQYSECRAFYLRHKTSFWHSKMSLSRKVYCWLYYNGFPWINKIGQAHMNTRQV